MRKEKKKKKKREKNVLLARLSSVLFLSLIHSRKKINALFFDNSIEIELADGQRHFFATFLNRDKVSISSPPLHVCMEVYIQRDTAETEREREGESFG